MKYTIVIPVYNGEETIGDCLRAVVAQEGAELGRDYSVIVVDDGSTDKTVDIARRFPVRIIELGSNQGRIVARMTGAGSAESERIVFIDSRVIAAPDVIRSLGAYEEYPAVMGSYDARASKYKTLFDTVFFLIRRQFYGSENFPQKTSLLKIDRKNFKRAPKGTTLLCIDRELFLELTPERTDKTVNDDTLLFHNLVYSMGLPLVRADNVQFEYIQRTEMNSFVPWLYERGIRFSDFYLRPGGYLFKPFVAVISVLVLLFMALFLFLFVNPSISVLLISVLVFSFLLVALYISECIKDFCITVLILPIILAVFSTGVMAHFLGNRFREK